MKRDNFDDAAPGCGRAGRLVFDPKVARAQALAPDVRCDLDQLTAGRHLSMGSGDAKPPRLRPGSDVASRLPSRVGDTLRWPDGRVTGLRG